MTFTIPIGMQKRAGIKKFSTPIGMPWWAVGGILRTGRENSCGLRVSIQYVADVFVWAGGAVEAGCAGYANLILLRRGALTSGFAKDSPILAETPAKRRSEVIKRQLGVGPAA